MALPDTLTASLAKLAMLSVILQVFKVVEAEGIEPSS
tara:strand:- start:262 stop:372 length:111 start_codon:yes stop_codon:yes gene_type:complete